MCIRDSEIISIQALLMESKELLYAGVLSSGIAFMLQVYSQQNLSPAPVAIIFSLEGVFGAIAAWIMLDQYLNHTMMRRELKRNHFIKAELTCSSRLLAVFCRPE